MNGPFGDNCDGDPLVFSTQPPLTQLPAKAVLVSASRCIYDYEVVPGDGIWINRIEQQATKGLDALADALRLPSEPPSGIPCPSPVVPVLTVTDSTGLTIHPLVPHDGCDHPLDAAAQAIMAIPWMDISTTRVRQVQSEAETLATCPTTWQAMLAQAASNSGDETITPDTSPPGLLVCNYELDPASTVTGADAKTYQNGKLAGAFTLAASASHTFMVDVAAASVAGGCDAPQVSFDVVFPLYGRGSYLIVERGGCYRALLDGETALRQLDSTAVTGALGG